MLRWDSRRAGGLAGPTLPQKREPFYFSSTVRRPPLLRSADWPDRLVDCTALKRAFEAFYETLLPKNAHPFIYLALEVDPTKLDVNIHPTKQEVHLMDSDDIVEVVCESLGKVLAAGSESRSYKVQVNLRPGWTR